MAKQITVDFYRLSVGQGGEISFKEILKQVYSLSIQDRILQKDDFPVWLHEASIEDQYIAGDIIRLRMKNLPSKGNLSGIINNLDFKNDEGISEHTAVFYHIDTHVLLLQKVQGGVDIGKFTNYFEEILNNTINIIDKPILDIDVIRRLDKVKDIRSYEVKFARPDNLDCFTDVHDSVEELLRINSELNSLTIEVKFSVGRKKNTSLTL